jgi:hypothetical protein
MHHLSVENLSDSIHSYITEHRFPSPHFFFEKLPTSTTLKFDDAIPVNLWELLGGRSPPYQLATTRYNFVRLKATHKISPLEELVGGRSPP